MKSATLYLAVDGWADIWLNGIPIRESQPSTPETKGFQTIQCLPEHLCYFQNENVLAIENANAYRATPPLNGQIGIAYVLKLRFSDGTETTLSSDDIAAHKAYYLPNRESGEPQGWQRTSFYDGNWSMPYSLGSMVPDVASLPDPDNHGPTQFLSAEGNSFKTKSEGEKHLYRREFHLNIGPNPLCGSIKTNPKAQPTVTVPRIFPTNTFTPQPILAPPTLTLVPTEIPTPIPVFIWQSTPTPTLFYVSKAVPTWTLIPLSTPTPTFTIIHRVVQPSPTYTVAMNPTPVVTPRPKRRKPTPTPVYDFGVSSRVDPFENQAPAVAIRTATPVPTQALPPNPVQAQAQTIVFERLPANIYISFADGLGVYRLEVVDASGSHLRNLFEKRVVAETDDWVEWDGKNDAGQDVPAGQYTVLYTKDGKQLNKLVVVKTAGP